MGKVFRSRWVFLSIAFLTISASLSGQKHKNDSLTLKHLEKTDIGDFVSQLFAGKVSHGSNPKEKTHFSVIPIAPASGGKGVSLSAINASFYSDPESNLSTIYFYPYTNFTTAYGLFLSPYIWLNKNEWNGTGDFRLVYNGLRDYGIGGRVPPSDYTVIKHSQWRSYFTAHTRIFENFYLGVGYNLDYFWGVVEDDPTPETPSDFKTYGIGTGSETVSSGITFNILRDNRKNPVNPSNGMYSTLILRVNRKAMGSTTEWGSVFFDVRRYLSFSAKRHKVLAGRAFFWGTYGDVPYFNLPTTFEDPSWRAGRGYLTNRFRGQHWMFAESEYRFDISSRGFFGGVLFANVQSYSDPGGGFARALAAAGFGFRFKFNRHSDTNLTLDFAYGKEGWNWYINLGEYF